MLKRELRFPASMMAITHAAIAAAGVSLLFGTADPLPLGLAVLGSQLPDLDTTTRPQSSEAAIWVNLVPMNY
jgi:hypothetical protein